MLGLYSHRRLGMIGSFIVFVAVAVSSAVPSVMILFATYGLVLGFGCALSSTVGMLILQEYFAQRRPLANGIVRREFLMFSPFPIFFKRCLECTV